MMKALSGAVTVVVCVLSVAAVGQRAYAAQDYCAQIACYGPGQIQQAYGLPSLYARGITGKGVTIAVVDPYGSSTIGTDLAAFDTATGLPAPPSLTVVSPDGQLPSSPDASTWAVETTLDVEYAHAVAPRARIVVTEALPDLADIISAERYVVKHYHAEVISQSLTETEQTAGSASDIATMHADYASMVSAGVSVVASSGDTGAANTEADGATYYSYPATSYPASDPLVTGVGGTDLSLNAAREPAAPATVWNDTYDTSTNEIDYANAGPNPLASGGGKSVLFARPAYQDGVGDIVGNSRGVPDVSMSAACSAPVEVYLTDGPGPSDWLPACGTSEAAPLFAGVVALADQLAGHPLGAVNTALYQLAAAHASGIVPVTSGNNTVSFYQDGAEQTVGGYQAGPAGSGISYSLAAGVGTIDAAAFVPELAAQLTHDTAATRATGAGTGTGTGTGTGSTPAAVVMAHTVAVGRFTAPPSVTRANAQVAP
jgi:subtilase family serine protease